MNIKEKSERDFGLFVTKTLFGVYLITLIWAVLFKFKIDFSELKGQRHVILKPFFVESGHLNKPDFYPNIVGFVPFGLYLPALKREGKFFFNVLVFVFVIAASSLFFETSQYIFKIGCSDVNDLISNTLGGVIGIACYYILYLIFRKYTNTVINILAGLFTAAAVIFVIVSIANGTCSEFQNRLTVFFSF